MQYESNRAGQGTEYGCHGGCTRRQYRSIRSGAFCPPTVLAADPGDGALSALGWWSGLSSCLTPIAAVPRRRELAAASEDTAS